MKNILIVIIVMLLLTLAVIWSEKAHAAPSCHAHNVVVHCH